MNISLYQAASLFFRCLAPRRPPVVRGVFVSVFFVVARIRASEGASIRARKAARRDDRLIYFYRAVDDRAGVQFGGVTRLRRGVIANGLCSWEKPHATAVRWQQPENSGTAYRHPATGLSFSRGSLSAFSRDHHEPTAGFSVPEVSTAVWWVAEPAYGHRRGLTASRSNPENPSRTPTFCLFVAIFSRRLVATISRTCWAIPARFLGRAVNVWHALSRERGIVAIGLMRVEISCEIFHSPCFTASPRRQANEALSVHPCVNAKFVT